MRKIALVMVAAAGLAALPVHAQTAEPATPTAEPQAPAQPEQPAPTSEPAPAPAPAQDAAPAN